MIGALLTKSKLWFFQSVVMHGCESCTIEKTELWWSFWLMLLNYGVAEPLRVPWTARRKNQSILKEINPKYSLERMILKLRPQYFGHVMQRTDHWKRPWCWERLKARGARWRQRMRWLNDITDLMDIRLSKLQELVMGRKAWHPEVHGVTKNRTQLSNWTKLN